MESAQHGTEAGLKNNAEGSSRRTMTCLSYQQLMFLFRKCIPAMGAARSASVGLKLSELDKWLYFQLENEG